MRVDRGIYIASLACALLAVTAIGIGYALGSTSTTEVSDNTLTDETVIVSPGGDSTYSGSFDKEVEFHIGTRIVNGQRQVEYTPCSWYMQEVQGKSYYNLGSIHLTVDAPSSLTNLTLNMKTINPYSMSQEFVYKVKAEVNGRTYLEPFAMDEGSTFTFDSSAARDIVGRGVDLTLYMEAKTIDYLPSMILDGTIFSFTATVD